MYKALIVGVFLLISIIPTNQYLNNTEQETFVLSLENEKNTENDHNSTLSSSKELELELEQKSVFIDSDERECLAKVIYWEARNQSLDGKIAVGYVVLNRVSAGLWKDTICKVVNQGCQFSWVCTNKAKRNLNALKNEEEKNAWAEAISLANELLSEYNDIEDVTYGATFFHAHYVKPYWTKWKKIERTVRIDDHIFYRFREM